MLASEKWSQPMGCTQAVWVMPLYSFGGSMLEARQSYEGALPIYCLP